MKQTAVQWYMYELANGKMPGDEAYKQALEMEKEQMNKMFDAGVDRGYDCVHSDKWAEEPTHPTFEQYYNETFKSE